MGARYRTARPQHLNYMYRPPLELMQQALDKIDMGVEATYSEIEALSFGQANATERAKTKSGIGSPEYLTQDAEDAQERINFYEAEIDGLAKQLDKDAINYAKIKPKIRDVRGRIRDDLTTGPLAIYQQHKTQLENWEKEQKAAGIDPMYLARNKQKFIDDWGKTDYNDETGEYNELKLQNLVDLDTEKVSFGYAKGMKSAKSMEEMSDGVAALLGSNETFAMRYGQEYNNLISEEDKEGMTQQQFVAKKAKEWGDRAALANFGPSKSTKTKEEKEKEKYDTSIYTDTLETPNALAGLIQEKMNEDPLLTPMVIVSGEIQTIELKAKTKYGDDYETMNLTGNALLEATNMKFEQGMLEDYLSTAQAIEQVKGTDAANEYLNNVSKMKPTAIDVQSQWDVTRLDKKQKEGVEKIVKSQIEDESWSDLVISSTIPELNGSRLKDWEQSGVIKYESDIKEIEKSIESTYKVSMMPDFQVETVGKKVIVKGLSEEANKEIAKNSNEKDSSGNPIHTYTLTEDKTKRTNFEISTENITPTVNPVNGQLAWRVGVTLDGKKGAIFIPTGEKGVTTKTFEESVNPFIVIATDYMNQMKANKMEDGSAIALAEQKDFIAELVMENGEVKFKVYENGKLVPHREDMSEVDAFAHYLSINYSPQSY